MRAAAAVGGLLVLMTIAIAAAPEGETRYLSPGELVVSPDGQLLYVVCEKNNEVRVVGIKNGAVQSRIAVGRSPPDLLHPRVSPLRLFPHAARIRNQRDRCGEPAGCRTQAAPQCCRRLSRGACERWRFWRRRPASSQEPDPARPRGARLGLRRLPQLVRERF